VKPKNELNDDEKFYDYKKRKIGIPLINYLFE
jgi:hypothetical protein